MRKILTLVLFVSLALCSYAQGPGTPLTNAPGSPDPTPSTDISGTSSHVATPKELAEALKGPVRWLGHDTQRCLTDCSNANIYVHSTISWYAPKDHLSLAPNKYRISWGVNGKYTSYKKPNTDYRGNAFTTGTSFKLSGVLLEPGKTLHIRVRAIYCCGVRGKWSKITIPHSYFPTGD